MKLKIALLLTAAVAGAGASVALADHGGHGQKCKAVHLDGTLAAGSLSLTVVDAGGPWLAPLVAVTL